MSRTNLTYKNGSLRNQVLKSAALSLLAAVASAGLTEPVLAQTQGVTVSGNANQRPIPGSQPDIEHRALVKQDNNNRADQAAATKGSSLPRLTADETVNTGDPFLIVKPKETKTDVPSVKIPVQEEDKKTAKQQVPVVAPPQPAQQQPVVQYAKKTQETADREQKMTQSINGLLSGWNPVGQRVDIEYKGVANSGAQGAANGIGGAVPAIGATKQAGAQVPSVAADLKAGNILHAVVMTAVNSDEAGPVLAQIVSGPYTGGKLMGAFKMTQTQEKLILTFNVLTMPMASHSYSINGFAVDPDTGRTALNSDVDHHYFERYGMLLGASFIKGYSSALKSSNTTSQTSTGAAGTVITQTTPPLSTKDQAIVALGDVGAALASSLQGETKRPYTVTLNPGTPIGVLMMQDVTFK